MGQINYCGMLDGFHNRNKTRFGDINVFPFFICCIPYIEYVKRLGGGLLSKPTTVFELPFLFLITKWNCCTYDIHFKWCCAWILDWEFEYWRSWWLVWRMVSLVLLLPLFEYLKQVGLLVIMLELSLVWVKVSEWYAVGCPYLRTVPIAYWVTAVSISNGYCRSGSASIGA